MQVKTKFKQTEFGLIPEDWEIKLLRAFIERLDAGVSVNSVDEELRSYAHDEAILKTSAVVNGLFFPHESKKIAPTDIARAKLNPVADTIIISRMNTPDLVGECGYVEEDYPELFLPDRLWMTKGRKDNHVNMKWLSYLLSSRPFKKKIQESATGTSGSMKNISKQSLFSLTLVVPPLPEQRAIAAALSDVDALINSLDRLIAKKRDIKQATMQQLLTGKTRLPGFTGAWRTLKLGEICGAVTTGKLDANAMVLDGEFPFFTCARQPCAIDTFAFDAEALLVSGNGANVGYIHHYRGKFNAYQRTYVLLNFSENILYVKMFMDKFLQDRIRIEVNAGNTPYIKMDTLTEMSIQLPASSNEQKAIVSVLDDIETELTTLEQRRDKTLLLKQGMMQELLTGRTRLL